MSKTPTKEMVERMQAWLGHEGVYVGNKTVERALTAALQSATDTPSPPSRAHAVAVLEKLREEIGDAYEKGIPRPSTLLEWCQFIDNAISAPAPQQKTMPTFAEVLAEVPHSTLVTFGEKQDVHKFSEEDRRNIALERLSKLRDELEQQPAPSPREDRL